jgi:hypothetical protein
VPAVTPAAVVSAFAQRGAIVSRVPKPPKLCDAKACRSMTIFGGAFVCLAPKATVDFFVALLPSPADATRVAKVGQRGGLGVVTHGSTLLVYLKSSTRIARLRAALASLSG